MIIHFVVVVQLDTVFRKPFLIKGDKTILQPGMVFAVDGSVLTNDFRAQVGDSFIITETGYEQITHHPKTVDEIII
uniref:Peptidase M24 domain-containing protein n=1 Tax=uncultured marine bacterium MedDCM-OCT-S04-C749 TaxID=743061 RepID=D6PD88_9BACT|nr:hypothetical protein [uncultured marine bacterium MedDCM-OCT-S04-C749]